MMTLNFYIDCMLTKNFSQDNVPIVFKRQIWNNFLAIIFAIGICFYVLVFYYYSQQERIKFS